MTDIDQAIRPRRAANRPDNIEYDLLPERAPASSTGDQVTVSLDEHQSQSAEIALNWMDLVF